MSRHAASMPPPSAHRYTTRVYYEDTDAAGVVYHASYLRMAERARTEALRDQQASHAALMAEHKLMFVVRRVEVDYAAPAHLDDSLVVATWPERLGNASIDLRQTFLRGGDVLVSARIGLVCVSRAVAGLSVARVPDRWRNAIASLGVT